MFQVSFGIPYLRGRCATNSEARIIEKYERGTEVELV